MYTVIYYPVGKCREYQNGFTSREQAWNWIKPRVESNEVDTYQIIPQS